MAGFFNCSLSRVEAKYSMLDGNGKVIRDKGIRLQKFLRTFSDNKEAVAVT